MVHLQIQIADRRTGIRTFGQNISEQFASSLMREFGEIGLRRSNEVHYKLIG